MDNPTRILWETKLQRYVPEMFYLLHNVMVKHLPSYQTRDLNWYSGMLEAAEKFKVLAFTEDQDKNSKTYREQLKLLTHMFAMTVGQALSDGHRAGLSLDVMAAKFSKDWADDLSSPDLPDEASARKGIYDAVDDFTKHAGIGEATGKLVMALLGRYQLEFEDLYRIFVAKYVWVQLFKEPKPCFYEAVIFDSEVSEALLYGVALGLPPDYGLPVMLRAYVEEIYKLN